MNFENLLGCQVFKTTIAIRFNLLQASSIRASIVFAVLFISSFNVSSTQFGGSCYCLNFYIRDTAPLISFVDGISSGLYTVTKYIAQCKLEGVHKSVLKSRVLSIRNLLEVE